MIFEVREFWITLAVNLLVTIGYAVWARVYRRLKKRSVIMRALVMLLCPVVGPVYYFLGWIFRLLFFYKPVNLEDVLFSKNRESILVKAEEEKEMNLVPVEDALVATDKENMRELLLDVIKRDPQKSLYSISLALDSEDVELSHYAASIIQSELDKMRKSIQESSKRIFAMEEDLTRLEGEKGWIRTIAGARFFESRSAAADDAGSGDADSGEGRKYSADIATALEASADYSRHNALAFVQGEAARRGEDYEEEKSILQELTEEMERAHEIIQEIDTMLSQRLLSDFESSLHTETLNKIARLIEKRDVLAPHEIEVVVQNCLKVRDFESATEWYEKSLTYYPDAISSHASRLRVLFAQDDREGFFKALDELKKSNIPLDYSTLELVRFFA